MEINSYGKEGRGGIRSLKGRLPTGETTAAWDEGDEAAATAAGATAVTSPTTKFARQRASFSLFMVYSVLIFCTFS
jgi:hypothetical protein